MEARTVNLPPAALHDGAVRCLLAIELSKKSWVVAINTPLSDKISLYKLKSCDWKGLLELIERIRKRVAQDLKQHWKVAPLTDGTSPRRAEGLERRPCTNCN